jgi:hypothetical protein
MKWLQDIIRVFKTPSADVLAVQELEDARRMLLSCLSAQEYYSSQVTYQKARVARLTKTVSEVQS